MSTYKILSLDESGKPIYSHPSREFALAGIIVDEKIKGRLDQNLRKLKKKFFNDEEVVFHYAEIVRKIGQFKVLKDKKIEINFWCEVLSILDNPKINYLFTIVNKEKAKKAGWLEKTIVQRSYAQIIKMFVTHLKEQKQKGKIITESEKFQDEYLIKAHNTCQSTGIPALTISGKDYNEMITSLSLVNKNNFDPELQLVDLLGATARLRYRIERLKSKEKISQVEGKTLRMIERKLKQKTAEFEVIL